MRLITLFLICLPNLLWANDWSALREPGAIAIMRHALAPGGGDPSNHTIDDCTTQRNLSDAGRDQARHVGAALRAENIQFDGVFTSQWCRTRETATLLNLGTPSDLPALNSFFENRIQRGPQTADLRRFLETNTGPLMLVTHQVNISVLTGSSTRSGEIIVFRMTDAGTDILGRIFIEP